MMTVVALRKKTEKDDPVTAKASIRAALLCQEAAPAPASEAWIGGEASQHEDQHCKQIRRLRHAGISNILGIWLTYPRGLLIFLA
jgi:hypothetical protein